MKSRLLKNKPSTTEQVQDYAKHFGLISPTTLSKTLGVSKQRIAQIAQKCGLQTTPHSDYYLLPQPCPICEKPFKPQIVGPKRRQKTCSAQCGAKLRYQWCGRGLHYLTPDAVYITSQGWRLCKQCHWVRTQKRRTACISH